MQKQIAIIALASAIASRHAPLTRALRGHFADVLSEAEANGARAAAAIMGMNNIYYRFVHLVEDEEYATLRASLRMNVMSTRAAKDRLRAGFACRVRNQWLRDVHGVA